jgi:hypothetical protein
MSKRLNAGDTVTIYEDPLTARKVEGQAKLIRRVSDRVEQYENVALEFWRVQFEGEDMVVYRAVRVEVGQQ